MVSSCVLLALAVLGLLPAGARAADTGGATPLPGAQDPAKPPPRPVISDVRCAGNPSGDCIEQHRVDQGGTVVVQGRNMAAVTQIVFMGKRGRRDDQSVPVTSADSHSATAQVPQAARTGPIAALTTGPRSARWTGLLVDSPSEVLKPYSQAAIPAPVEAKLAQPRRIYVGGLHKSVFRFKLSGSRALDVQVNVVRQKDGAVVRVLRHDRVAPGIVQRIAWDGTSNGKKPLPDGRYVFQVVGPGATASSLAGKAASDEAVTLSNYEFPVRGSHTYGGPQTRFGAPRAGHSHAGQDVFARCGTLMVAARAGKVIYSGYEGAAGYYVAINGERTGSDFTYMHLKEPPLVSRGDHVYTGQQIGYVGESGNAVGCHLHFELWTAPGWYNGGHPFDPLPSLKRWDSSIRSPRKHSRRR